MFIYLIGLCVTGFLFVATPWNLFPLCLSQISIHSAAELTISSSNLLHSGITRWFGAVTLLCMLLAFSATNRSIMAGALIIAGLMALVIIAVYLLYHGNNRQMISPCCAKNFFIAMSVGVTQLALAVGGLRKLQKDGPSSNT